MSNVRVGYLSDLLAQAHENEDIWVRNAIGVVRRVLHVKRPADVDKPDIVLVAANKIVVGEFEDQRVKLDLDKRVLQARDTRGESRDIALGYCAFG